MTTTRRFSSNRTGGSHTRISFSIESPPWSKVKCHIQYRLTSSTHTCIHTRHWPNTVSERMNKRASERTSERKRAPPKQPQLAKSQTENSANETIEIANKEETTKRSRQTHKMGYYTTGLRLKNFSRCILESSASV